MMKNGNLEFHCRVGIYVMCLVSFGFGQSKVVKSVTISEPASVSIETLFTQADLVAFVQIRSGDAENYKAALYKATVLKAYKGAHKADTIYFTPFISYGLGSEYLVFLKNDNKHIGDIIGDSVDRTRLPYDPTLSILRIMYEGYSVMRVSYECVFDGPISEGCDDAVKFNVDQVTLPRKVKAVPTRVNGNSDANKYIRKKELEMLLNTIRGSK